MSATKTKKSTAIKADPGREYAWRPNHSCGVPAHVAGPELERIAKGNGESIAHLKPAQVVDEARDEDAILHPAFEWDDATAAEKHRENQARSLVRNLVVVEVTPGPKLPGSSVSVSVEPTRSSFAYVHVRNPDVGPCYQPAREVMADPDLRKLALAEALGQLRGLQRRYSHLTELSGVFAAIDRVAAQPA